MKKILLFALLALSFSSCDELFEPAPENIKDMESMKDNAEFSMGLLSTAYKAVVNNNQPSSDYATDNCVTNASSNGYTSAAMGSWTSVSTPFKEWNSCRTAVQYINQFLVGCDEVVWDKDPLLNTMFRDRLKGEAHALRAYFNYILLRTYGGETSDGRFLGIPLPTTPEDIETGFNTPRSGYRKSLDFILSDVEESLKFLPVDYVNVASLDDVPEAYRNDPTMRDASVYNRVFGAGCAGRISGRIAKVVRAQTALMAASPAYAEVSNITWDEVASYASDILVDKGGLSFLSEDGNTWYDNAAELESLSTGSVPDEIIWRSSLAVGNSLEKSHYPPTLNGTGRCNPSQNLVDAFPMLNGYPISDDVNSGYLATNPYAGRDPRLALYIVLNGSKIGSLDMTINTASDSSTIDGLNKELNKSTRTGYYMRKMLRSDINLTKGKETSENHYNAYMRFTEIFLIYAEAANEIYGPMGAGEAGFSAFDVIKRIRERAGICVDAADPYLESCAGDVAKMRELIHNERRLELCFENVRFWDLRRWGSDLNEAVAGVNISAGAYAGIDVEERQFKDYMIYCPIPNDEILKFSSLVQNKGW